MSMWFSPENRAFFNRDIGNCTEVSYEHHNYIINGMRSGRTLIVVDRKPDLLDNEPGVSIPPPESIDVLDKLKADAILEIDKVRDRDSAGGVIFNGYLYDSDKDSCDLLSYQITLLAAGGSLPEGFFWRTKDNQNIPIDFPGLLGLGQALAKHIGYQRTLAMARKDLIRSANSIDILNERMESIRTNTSLLPGTL